MKRALSVLKWLKSWKYSFLFFLCKLWLAYCDVSVLIKKIPVWIVHILWARILSPEVSPNSSQYLSPICCSNSFGSETVTWWQLNGGSSVRSVSHAMVWPALCPSSECPRAPVQTSSADNATLGIPAQLGSTRKTWLNCCNERTSSSWSGLPKPEALEGQDCTGLILTAGGRWRNILSQAECWGWWHSSLSA